MFLTRLFTLVALAGYALAHFQLLYPPTRGYIAALEVEEPCGSFNNLTERTPYSLEDSFVGLKNGHSTANVIVLISFSEDPIGINDFTYHDGTRTPPLRDWFQITEGDACIDVNIGSMNYAAAAEGKNATIQIQYSAGEGILYQCADIVLSSAANAAAPPSNFTCANNYTVSDGPEGSDPPSSAVRPAITTAASLFIGALLSMWLM